LSGYDIKLQMNGRLGPFWKVGSNQVYPELSKMEAEGLVKLQGVEQHTYRPAKKLYEITQPGRDALVQWTLESGGVENVRDDFLLKTFNAWLVEPDQMKAQVEAIREQHEGRLAEYSAKIAELTSRMDPSNPRDPLASTLFVVEFGVRYEQLYLDWCDHVLKKL